MPRVILRQLSAAQRTSNRNRAHLSMTLAQELLQNENETAKQDDRNAWSGDHLKFLVATPSLTKILLLRTKMPLSKE